MLSVISREPTPNPNAHKFHTGAALLEFGQLSFRHEHEAGALPLARELFDSGAVEAVLIAEDFVSVSALPEADWDEIEGIVQRELATYSVADASRLAEQQAAASKLARAGLQDNELYPKIEEVLERWVRPALAGDGGGIELIAIEDKNVLIRYQGACGSCPTSTANTLMAIENLLQDQVDPEITVMPA